MPLRLPTRLTLPPLRSFERVVAGYGTAAFAIAGWEAIALRRWGVVPLALAMAAAGGALLVRDHRRWRAGRDA